MITSRFHLITLSATILAMAASSCSGNEADFIDFTQVDGIEATDITLSIDGGSASLTFNSTGAWTITHSGYDWIACEPMRGEGGAAEITVTAEAFDAFSGASSRIGFITFTCGSFTKKIAVVQMSDAVNGDATSEVLKVRQRGGDYDVEVPSGISYNVSIPAAAQSWITCTNKASGLLSLHFDENTCDASRSAIISAVSTSGEEIATINAIQSWRNIETGEFLIEEIYFTGTPLPSTGVPNSKNKDQYFLITNNTDELLYADGLLIIESKNANAGLTWKEFIDPIIDEFCEAGTVMCVPGTGCDVPVNPGESLLIVSNGLNFREGYSQGSAEYKVEMNPDGLDLSVADFEWYTESTNSTIDIDVPEVPNMDMWFCYTLSILVLHDRGFQSYALAVPPKSVTKESYVADYAWDNADYISHTLAGDFYMTLTSVYKVPNSWVIDAVMCTVPSINQTRQFSTSLDAGWTWASPQDIDSDPQRYGLSVRRKRDTSTGKLIDTNNSTNDFIPNSTPSIKSEE